MTSAPAPSKVLWVSCVGEKGGAEVYLLNFLRHLDRRRYTPAVVLLRPGAFETDLKDADIETFVLQRHRMRNLAAVARSILQIRGLVRRHGVRLIHSNAFRGHTYGGLAARFAGVPAVWSVHCPEVDGVSTRVNLRIPVASVTANCPRTADWYAARRFPVNLIWPPVDLDRLQDRTPRSALASKYGLPVAGRWVGMASRLQRYKGHEYLLRATAALPASQRDVHVIIIGGALFGMEEDYLDQLKALANQLGIADRAHFPGFVPDADLHGLVDGCEVMVHPALDEDFGLIVAESQALEKPVVAFASVGPAAIIQDGVTGRLVPVGDQEGLQRSLAGVLDLSTADRERLGRAGRERVQRLFAAPTAARRLEKIYDACLGGRPMSLDALRQPVIDDAGC
ncbi:MAG: glycosyltransferase family 4 protein [Verrucomicrobiales bacterium]|nr:glycosyltransferase family 4 protein [Verrucomicrobiales bacterium]